MTSVFVRTNHESFHGRSLSVDNVAVDEIEIHTCCSFPKKLPLLSPVSVIKIVAKTFVGFVEESICSFVDVKLVARTWCDTFW